MKPFSDQNTYKNTTMFSGQLVEHLTSWLTVNPYKGCSLKCAYCFRYNWHKSEIPRQVNSVNECFNSLINHKEFIAHITPISINNSSTDPLLSKVRKTTFRFIALLEENQYQNPFIIISKLSLSHRELVFLKGLKFIQPIFFTSFSLIPKHIEPSPVEPRIRNLKNLQLAGIPSVLYFRPIVKGWNDDSETIEKVLKTGQEYCTAICIGGLRMSPEIRAELENVGEYFTDFPDDFDTKEFQGAIELRVLNQYKKLRLTVPLFKHSSCGVSLILGISNYNHLFKNPEKNCMKTCPLYQRNTCFKDGSNDS